MPGLGERLRTHWQSRGLQIRPGTTQQSLDDFERRHGITLPTDLGRYLLTVDGMEDEMDSSCITFWPLGKIRTVADEFEEQRRRWRAKWRALGRELPSDLDRPGSSSAGELFIIADYLLWSWAYAIRVTPGASHSPVYVVHSDDNFEKFAGSFAEFVEYYLECERTGRPVGCKGAVSRRVNPDDARARKAPAAIEGMFSDIAPRYDLANTILSGGMHDSWRRWAAADLVTTARRSGEGPPRKWLDACGGTGDFAIADARAAGAAGRVLCTDFSGPMLAVAKKKLHNRGMEERVPLSRADALRLPARDGSFDALTVAFGIRNVSDPRRGLREFARVLRRGGWCGVLEFGLPTLPIARELYSLYFVNVLPTLGAAVARGRRGNAYAYFRDSVRAFPSGGDFAAWMREDGFESVVATPILFGIVWWYLGRRR